MTLFGNQREETPRETRGFDMLGILRILLIQLVILVALAGAAVGYLNWSSEMEWAEFDPATGVRITEHQHPWSATEHPEPPPVPRSWSETSASPP